MGLGFVTGAIGIPINGAIADRIGLRYSLMTHVFLVLATMVLAWFLPSETVIERHAAAEATPHAVVPQLA